MRTLRLLDRDSTSHARQCALFSSSVIERSYIAANLAARALRTAVNVEIQVVRQKIPYLSIIALAAG